MFDIDLLRSFVAVAESGGFTRAAARLNSTQSTVSAQIQRLEAGAGHALFVRSTRSVRLTPPGEILLGYARTILRLNKEVQIRLSGNAGRLRVGAAEDFAGWLLPQILRSFGHRYPDVQIEVEIGMGASLFAMIETRSESDCRRLEMTPGCQAFATSSMCSRQGRATRARSWRHSPSFAVLSSRKEQARAHSQAS